MNGPNCQIYSSSREASKAKYQQMITEYEVHSDERYEHYDASRYLFLGGVVSTDRGSERLRGRLTELRGAYNLQSEMRWQKVSKSYLDAYRAWLSTFFEDPHAKCVVLVVNCSGPDWRNFHPRPDRKPTRDDRLASVFYQFLLVTFGSLRDTKRWWVFPDAGFFSRDNVLDRVEFLFNRTYKRAFGSKTSRIIRLARALDSKRNDLVQLADLLLACSACAHLEKVPLATAKRELVEHYRREHQSVERTQRGLQKVSVSRWVPPQQLIGAR